MIKHAVFSYKDKTVGIVVWGDKLRWHTFKFFPTEDQVCNDYLSIVEDNLNHWISTSRLPYMEDLIYPYEDVWWDHVRKLLNHEIRLGKTNG